MGYLPCFRWPQVNIAFYVGAFKIDLKNPRIKIEHWWNRTAWQVATGAPTSNCFQTNSVSMSKLSNAPNDSKLEIRVQKCTIFAVQECS